MPIESGDKIEDLKAQWPLGTDPKAQGDDHLRLLKTVLKNDVASLSGDNDFTGDITINGQPIDALTSGRNALINGNFDVWQRLTGPTAIETSNSFFADRWRVFNASGKTGVKQSRQEFALGQSDVPNNPKFFHRTEVTTSGTEETYANLSQGVEGIEVLAGETVTLSFWAKADAARQVVSEVNQVGDGQAGGGDGAKLFDLTTEWQFFTHTFQMPSLAGQELEPPFIPHVQFIIWFDAGADQQFRVNGLLGQQSGVFDIAQVQFEKGAAATPYENKTYAEELLACQRYFYKLPAGTETVFGLLFANRHMCRVPFPVTMRAEPTASTPVWRTNRFGSGSFLYGAALTVKTTYSYKESVGFDVSSVGGNFVDRSGAMELETDVTFDAEI